MIQPVNGHLLIDPVTHESFMQTQRDTFEEIGTIVAIDQYGVGVALEDGDEMVTIVKVGDRVYFDAWLAAKYPKEGKDDEFYWLVKWDDVRAIEHVEPE